MMPEVGEIWEWSEDREAGYPTFKVLLLETAGCKRFRGLIVSELGHGEIDIWHFEQPDDWEKVA